MSEYTEEDFKNARFAVLPKYGLRAHKSAGEFYWQRDGIKRATNPEMAAAGWRPVREHNPHATDALEEEIQDLRDENARLGGEVTMLRESAKLRDVTMEQLASAYAWAEVPTEDSSIREGDEVIGRHAESLFSVRKFKKSDLRSDTEFRILKRKPQPEPWQAFADSINEAGSQLQEGIIRVLHAHGVRVTGGDET